MQFLQGGFRDVGAAGIPRTFPSPTTASTLRTYLARWETALWKAIAIRSAPPVLHEKLMQQVTFLSVHDLRKAVKEAKLESGEVEDYRQIQDKLFKFRTRVTTAKLATLDPSELDSPDAPH